MKNKKDKKRAAAAGSFTVEAALLMTILLPLLTALIYLGFYQHDKIWMQDKIRTEAVELSMQKTKKETIDGKGLLGSRNSSGSAVRKKKQVSANMHGTFFAPEFVRVFFTGCNWKMDVKTAFEIKNAKKEILKYQNIERLQEE